MRRGGWRWLTLLALTVLWGAAWWLVGDWHRSISKETDMELGIVLLQALIAGAVAAGVYQLIVGWGTRSFVALWLALSLIAWVGLAGPIKLG